MPGWIYIVLSSACSVLIAHLLKTVEFRKINTLRVLTVNYVIATIIAFYSAYESFETMDPWQISGGAVGLALIVGVFFITNFFIYSKSVFHNGVGVSISAMRISLIIPVLLSTVWYLEILNIRQWVGVMLVFVALLLLLPQKRNFFKKPFNASWLLLLLFLCTGFGDTSLKIFEAEFKNTMVKETFMGMVFFAAMISGFFVVAIRNMWDFSGKEVFFGIVIGIPNLYSSIFLIDALMVMNGAVVYTVVNILTVLGGTILGLLKWGDILTRAQWTGIFVTLFAIILLL